MQGQDLFFSSVSTKAKGFNIYISLQKSDKDYPPFCPTQMIDHRSINIKSYKEYNIAQPSLFTKEESRAQTSNMNLSTRQENTKVLTFKLSQD